MVVGDDLWRVNQSYWLSAKEVIRVGEWGRVVREVLAGEEVHIHSRIRGMVKNIYIYLRRKGFGKEVKTKNNKNWCLVNLSKTLVKYG